MKEHVTQFMKKLEDILDPTRPIADIISDLQVSSVDVPKWEDLSKEYDPMQHEIVEDKTSRKDRDRSDGVRDKAARIPFGMEMLFSERLAEFMFVNPVRRDYSSDCSDVSLKVQKALEAVYEHARIDSINMERATSYFASCQNITFWYAKKKPNDYYGFHSEYKIKCKTFSPMDDYEFYPIIDDDEMEAMSFSYSQKEGNETIDFFETFTNDSHMLWRQGDGIHWEEVDNDDIYINNEQLKMMPLIYMYSKRSAFYGLHPLVRDNEYSHSEDSDTISYNASPVLAVNGKLSGEPMKKGEPRRVYRTEAGGKVEYVSWNQSVEAIDHHEKFNLKMMFMLGRVPDISFETLAGIGNIGYDAMQTMLTDVMLKCGRESMAFIRAFDREFNVIREVLKVILPSDIKKDWSAALDKITCKHNITLFSIKSFTQQVTDLTTANGGQPLMSQRESIQRLGISKDVDATISDINSEAEDRSMNSITDILNPKE